MSEEEKEELLKLEKWIRHMGLLKEANLIDKLQKQLDQLKEVDRQICCEELITKDKYQDILKENEELSQANIDLLEINQKLIEEKPIIKELIKKEYNLLEEIESIKRGDNND